VLDLLPPTCERIYAGKKRAGSAPVLTQEEINALLIARARAGRRVVRLKGGDPFIFGRGAEEALALRGADIAFEVVPGVSAAAAVPAYAGIPLTARGVTSTIAFATGHEAGGKPDSDVDWEALSSAGTLVMFMAVKTLGVCTARLMAAGKPADTPAAAIYWGTTAAQRCVIAPLDQLAKAVERAGLKPPALIVVGEVVRMRDKLSWFEARPLAGVRVLLTRGGKPAMRYAAALAQMGAEPLTAALTRRIEPSETELNCARTTLSRLREYDWVLFASANAVECFFSLLAQQGADARALAGARLACVGEATAAALRARSLRPDLVPVRADARGLAEAVLSSSLEVRGMRVLMPRAAEGRLEGDELLRSAGASVDAISLYRTVSAHRTDPGVARALDQLSRGSIRAVVFFAPSQVAALFTLLGEGGAREQLIRCPAVLAIGKTTRAALEQYGVRVCADAGRPDPEALAGALCVALANPPPADREEKA
jgi:uroporphyrinogen III methyltransferase/synthase